MINIQTIPTDDLIAEFRTHQEALHKAAKGIKAINDELLRTFQRKGNRPTMTPRQYMEVDRLNLLISKHREFQDL